MVTGQFFSDLLRMPVIRGWAEVYNGLLCWLIEAFIEDGTVRLRTERTHQEQQHAEEFHADNVAR